MKKFRLATATILVGAMVWPHRWAVLVEFRKLCVRYGLHFPMPFTRTCVCGLRLGRLDRWFWWDKMAFWAAMEQAQLWHTVRNEIDWYDDLEDDVDYSDYVREIPDWA